MPWYNTYSVKERFLNAVVFFRPCLSWRDVQHIIAISSVKVCEHASDFPLTKAKRGSNRQLWNDLMLVNLTLINSFDTIFTCPYTIDISFPTKCRSESFSNFEFFFFASQHDVDDDDYHTNGAGYHHSHKYGFGLLDSWRLVNTAKVIMLQIFLNNRAPIKSKL